MVKFTITTLGWLDCQIDDNDLIVKISHSSDYGDKFQELLNIFFIIFNSEFQNQVAVYEITWNVDISLFKWVIVQNEPHSIDIEIVETYVENPMYNKSVISFNITLNELWENIYASLKEIFATFGIVGYKNAWEVGNFPLAEFIELSAKYSHIALKLYEVFIGDKEGLKRLSFDQEKQVIGYV